MKDGKKIINSAMVLLKGREMSIMLSRKEYSIAFEKI